jgi:hypothetical protein
MCILADCNQLSGYSGMLSATLDHELTIGNSFGSSSDENPYLGKVLLSRDPQNCDDETLGLQKSA